MSSSNEYVPPGYVQNFNPRSSLFMITGSSEPGMDWLTPTGELRREKMGGAVSVAPFEAGAMKLAMAQVQGVFQIGFMLWMTGSQLTLFSMLFLMQALAPMYNILRLNAAFAPLAVPGANLILAKTAYVGINLLGCGLLLWKVKSLGLLPVTSADWVHLLPPKAFSDFSSAFF